jgi:hypothetical protein
VTLSINISETNLFYKETLIMNIEELANISGDSELVDYIYSNGCLEINMYIDEIDKSITIKANTDILEVNIGSANPDAVQNCFIVLVDLPHSLLSENNIYVPSSTFAHFMSEFRKGLHLAYGRDSRKYKYLLSITGAIRLLSFLVEDKEAIQVLIEQA